MERAKFDKDRHISYWQRCFKSLLPTDYTSTDSSRVLLGFFILSALDILGVGVDTLPPSDIWKLRSWILGCQHPSGGFCGSPNHKYPKKWYVENGAYNHDPDPANLPATFFAILSLSFVGGLSHVDRGACLKWLKRLQRKDGSFGEVLLENGKVEGGKDMRYCHFASGVRWMLRGDLGSKGGESYEDIDVDKLVKHIQAGETYEGGIGESSRHESHAGYTYTAIASLAFLDRLPESTARSPFGGKLASKISTGRETALTNLSGTIRWLLSRQLAYTDTDVDEDNQSPGSPQMNSDHGHPQAEMPSLAGLSLGEAMCVGFNGRANKLADTCYCYWVQASLEILGQGSLIDGESARSFLLNQTQHRIGGFGKQPGYPPDLYHSYLGLAALAMTKEPGLMPVDPVLCASIRIRQRIEEDMKKNLILWKTYWKHEMDFFVREDDPDYEQRIAEDEGPPKYLMDILQRINDQYNNDQYKNDPLPTNRGK